MDKINILEQKIEIIRCPCCGYEIDSDICWCGDYIKDHNIYCGHNPIPMGCECGRLKKSNIDEFKI